MTAYINHVVRNVCVLNQDILIPLHTVDIFPTCCMGS